MKRVSQFLRQHALLLFSLLPGSSAFADGLLRADHPAHYVVKKGDALWDISARFLRSPWRWPDIWYVNPQIANPHLIYPGDRLDLVYVNGKPQLRLSRGPVKLSPQVRSRPWDGTVEATRGGDPATVFFNKSKREAVIGDRLLPVSDDTSWTNFVPHQPKADMNGSIIAVLNGVAQIGQYNVVVLDRGARDGLEAGHVLRIDQRGETIRDVVTPDSRDTVTLPDEEAGLLMVFRTFDRVSFGLVLNAIRPIHILDRVHTP